MNLLERYRGALIGLAAGDALGTTLEFAPPGTFEPIDDMHGGGPFALEPGQWTDDTSMALCLADSLLECDGFDPVDQLRRFVRWYREGYHSSTGRCFDIGVTVRRALIRFETTGESWCGSTDPMSAGNGSIMRLAPVPLFFAPNPGVAIARAGDSSRTTHGVNDAVDACRLSGSANAGGIAGTTQDRAPRASVHAPAGAVDRRAALTKYRRNRRRHFSPTGATAHTRLRPRRSARSKQRCGRLRRVRRSSRARCLP